MNYCNNCENEAIKATADGSLYLCYTCADAFSWGVTRASDGRETHLIPTESLETNEEEEFNEEI